MKPSKTSLIFALFLIVFQNSVHSSAAQSVVTPPLTQCSIEVGDAHISKNLIRTRGLIAVKINAKSQCDKPVHNLVLTVEIYKKGLIFDHRVAVKALMMKEIVYANRIVKNQGTFVKCRNNTWSKYYGVAFAEALVDGKHMKTLHVRSENIERFQCGN